LPRRLRASSAAVKMVKRSYSVGVSSISLVFREVTFQFTNKRAACVSCRMAAMSSCGVNE